MTFWPPTTTAGIDYLQIWVNQAYKQVCSADYLFNVPKKVIIPELETVTTQSTTASTAYITEPTGATIVRHVFDDTNNFRLRNIGWAHYMDYTDRTNVGAYGNPTEWTRANGRIYVHPTPRTVSSLSIFYKKIPNDLTGDQTTEIGQEWDEPIVLIATWKGHQWLGEFDKADKVKVEIQDLLTAIIPPVHQEESDRSEWIRPDPAYIIKGIVMRRIFPVKPLSKGLSLEMPPFEAPYNSMQWPAKNVRLHMNRT